MPKAVIVPPPPYQTPIGTANGQPVYLSPVWQRWFQQMATRIGGTFAVSNPDLSSSNTAESQALTQLAVGTTNTTVYTSPAGQSTIIDTFTAKNNSISSQTLSIYVVPVGGSPIPASQSNTNQVLASQTIEPGESLSLSVMQNQVLGSGGMIVCIASAAGAIVVSASGRQIS